MTTAGGGGPARVARARHIAGRILWAVAWAGSVFLLLYLLVQVSGIGDHFKVTVWLTTFAPLVFAPAWPVAGVALWRHRQVLAATAALAALSGVWVIWPVLPMPGGPAGPDEGPTFTLGTVNSYKVNPRPFDLLNQVVADPPDVLLVQEYAFQTEVAFERTPIVSATWPFYSEASDGAAAVAVFSRLPILDTREVQLGNPALVVRVQVGTEVVTVVNLHTVATGRHSSAEDWRRSLEAVGRLAATIDGPLVLAGDFNATPYHKPFRDLLDGPLHDAHQDLDQALDRSWGPRRFGSWPVALIDHVVLSPDVRVLHIGDERAAGSDHRLVTAELRVGAGSTPPAPASPPP